MKHVRATSKTVVVSLIEISTRLSDEYKRGIDVPQNNSEVIAGLVVNAPDSNFIEAYSPGDIVLFLRGAGHKFVLGKKEYIIVPLDQIIGKIEEDQSDVRKLPSVCNDFENTNNIKMKWKTFFPKEMEIEEATLAILLENELAQTKQMSKNGETPELSSFLFGATVRIFKDNVLIQATDKPTVRFDDNSNLGDKLVTTVRLRTKLTRSELYSKAVDDVIAKLKEEIDNIGECVIYTPLIPMSVFGTEEETFAFMIRYWKPNEQQTNSNN